MASKPRRLRKAEQRSPAVLKQAVSESALPAGYGELLDRIKARIRQAQVRASLAASAELIRLYWDIGSWVVQRQDEARWGSSVIERLARDIRSEFPTLQSLSARNIWHARSLFLAYTRDIEKLKQPVSELDGKSLPETLTRIPWGHNIILLQKLKSAAQRLWYARAAIENGWSRPVLVHQIESGLHKRQGKALTNFKKTLPKPQSDLAQQIIKDPYTFDFLTLAADAKERELEQGLIVHIQKFLLELGVGFAFVGRQIHMEVGDEDFYIDLLFYHLRLRCYVVIELKTGPFKPEYAGKMNFYLSAVDDRMRHKDDGPSVGIILCKSKNKLIAEYALRDSHKPIGVSAYKLTRSLPEKLKGTLPTIKEIEKELERDGK